jgi:plasmid stabilization system protein ParE
MSRNTVVWSTTALDQLAELWMDSADREAVTAAAADVDRNLAGNPEAKGEAVHEGLRAFETLPLYVLYSASEPDRLVRVVRVRLHPPPVAIPNSLGAAPGVN